ncbi:MAG: hypothetical protein M3Y04_01585 [Actinomycetota bacterium]|nr:hypothetical protein [Actinomycetota bacterium]
MAKAVLLRRSATAFDTIGGTGAQGLVVDHDGSIESSAGLAAYLGGVALPRRLRLGAGLAPA